MNEQVPLEQALWMTQPFQPKAVTVEKTFTEKRFEEENKPLQVEIPEWVLEQKTSDNPNTLQSVETPQAPITEQLSTKQEEQKEEKKEETKEEIEEEKKEIQEAVDWWNTSVINSVIESLFRDKEELKYRNIDLEVENEHLKKTVQDLQKKLHSFKYDDERLPVHEKSRSLYLSEIQFYENPDDPLRKEKLVKRYAEKLEELTWLDYADKVNQRQNRWNISAISWLSSNNSTSAPSLSASSASIKPRGIPAPKRYF